LPTTCRLCGLSDFRVSRFRSTDLSHLFAFQYPVRCRKCGIRDYTSLLEAIKFKRESVKRHSIPKPN